MEDDYVKGIVMLLMGGILMWIFVGDIAGFINSVEFYGNALRI